MLTEKEKEEIDKLEKNFYLVEENNNYNYLASRRVDISRIWAKKLLKASFILNTLSIVLIFANLVILFIRPAPEFYASAPSGKIYHLKKLNMD